MDRPVKWPLHVQLDPADTRPLFAQIAAAITDAIERGRLAPGTTLPGSRTLAVDLGVHRNTVIAAYRELVSQGWLYTKRGRGTCVVPEMPERRRFRPPRSRVGTRAAFRVPQVHSRRPHPQDARFSLDSGVPDPRLAPARLLARALGSTLRRNRTPELGYGDPCGHLALRREIATMLQRRRGMAVDTDDVMVTRGSQMALYLVAQCLLRPGDVVAVESLGYAPAWDAFSTAGARLRGIPVDEEGLNVRALMRGTPPRAVYLTPHHHYPTTVTLSAPRRLELLAWAKEHRVAILEDDYDNEYHYEGQPVAPLAARSRESVVYVGTLSKVLAPGLRVGWVVAPANVREALAALRSTVDTQGAQVTEAALAQLLEDGELQRHIWRTKRRYQQRRDALVDALHHHLGSTLAFEVPRGGLALWARVAPDLDAEAWAERALARGVAVSPGGRYTLDKSPSAHLRIGFARHDPDELAQAVKLLARAR